MDIGPTATWIHVLIKGEKADIGYDGAMQEDEYIKEFSDKSLSALVVQPLQFVYKNLKRLQEILLKSIVARENFGLVLTSPRVVEALSRALIGFEPDERLLLRQNLDPDLVFVIGQKTASVWTQKTSLGYNVCSAKSGNATSLADYIRSHCEKLESPVKLIYPRGSLADRSLEFSSSDQNSYINIESIVVYETNVIGNMCDLIVNKLATHLDQIRAQTNSSLSRGYVFVNYIFFSPSSVGAFKTEFGRIEGELEKYLPNGRMVFSSIGRTTAEGLERHGFEVFCVADSPNARSLASCIVEKCSKISCCLK